MEIWISKQKLSKLENTIEKRELIEKQNNRSKIDC